MNELISAGELRLIINDRSRVGRFLIGIEQTKTKINQGARAKPN